MTVYQKTLKVRIRANHNDTLIAMTKVIDRYCKKMAVRGWQRQNTTEHCGNNISHWHHTITMQKSH